MFSAIIFNGDETFLPAYTGQITLDSRSFG